MTPSPRSAVGRIQVHGVVGRGRPTATNARRRRTTQAARRSGQLIAARATIPPARLELTPMPPRQGAAVTITSRRTLRTLMRFKNLSATDPCRDPASVRTARWSSFRVLVAVRSLIVLYFVIFFLVVVGALVGVVPQLGTAAAIGVVAASVVILGFALWIISRGGGWGGWGNSGRMGN